LAPFVSGIFSGKPKQRSSNYCKIFDMSPEEIAESNEGTYCFDISGWLCLLDGLESVFARFDTFWS
jgi:hypothetical protein